MPCSCRIQDLQISSVVSLSGTGSCTLQVTLADRMVGAAAIETASPWHTHGAKRVVEHDYSVACRESLRRNACVNHQIKPYEMELNAEFDFQ
jgi:hypothetical protein